MTSILLDPYSRTITEFDYKVGPSEAAELIGCERIHWTGLLAYDRDRRCEELFAADCERFDGPYLRIDHIRSHFHSRLLFIKPNHYWTKAAYSAGIWLPGRGLFRNLWQRA